MNYTKIIWWLVLALMMASGVTADEYQEAMQQTEEEWKAFRQTMQQGKSKLEEMAKEYKKYRDAVHSDSPEQGIELAKKLFNLDPGAEDAAREKLSQLREMFNKLDDNGLTEKLNEASGLLKKADGYAGEVENIWEFAKKFNPENAKDNPTYGLRLIGDILKEGGGKLEKIPLVGQILGKWVKTLGEAAGDYANALDRLTKKIDTFRGGNICAQSGKRQDQQAAFNAANTTGEVCTQYFATGEFSRLRGEAYRGNVKYFLYDPSTKQGYFVHAGNCAKVYRWHGLLIDRRALDVDWLADRANSLKPDAENRGRSYHARFVAWKDKTDNEWLLVDELKLTEDVFYYGKFDIETFVANYVLTDKHRSAIDKVVKEVEAHVLVDGTVYEDVDDEVKRSSGATVQFVVGGQSYSATTGADGDYKILMKGKPGDGISEKVSKEGFEEISRSGAMPTRVTVGLDYTLSKKGEEIQAVIAGKVLTTATADAPAGGASGATVTASAPGVTSLGSTTSGGDGSYALTVTVAENVVVTVAATLETATGSATVTVTGAAHSGVDITLKKEDEEETEKTEWTVNVTVLDDSGTPLPNATVTPSVGAAVVTGADGTATVGPIEVPDNWEEVPFVVTLTPSVTAEGGIKVGGSAGSVTYAGTTPSEITLTIPVLMPSDVTVSGRVTDAHGVGVDGAVVTGGGKTATSDASGAFTIGPFVLVKDSSVTLTASKTHGTDVFAGQAVTVTFDGANKAISGVVMVLDMESEMDVTISGVVHDADGKPIMGAAVTSGTAAATTDAGGSYTLPGVKAILGKAVTVTASVTDDQGNAYSGQADAVPTAEAATAPTIVIQVEQKEVHDVTVSGTVVDQQGGGVSGASVTAGSVSTTTDGSGSFSLGPVSMVSGDKVSVSASFNDGTQSYSGGPVTREFDGSNTSIGGVVVSLNVGSGDDDGDDEIDDAIDDVEDDSEGKVDFDALLVEFDGLVGELDAIAFRFRQRSDDLQQQLQSMGRAACESDEVTFTLSSARSAVENYTLSLTVLYGVYGELIAAQADNPDRSLGTVEAEFQRVGDQESTLQSRLAQLEGMYGSFGCDEQETETDDKSDPDGDPDDYEATYEVEKCDDGLDNDKDGEIDECDAGCCEHNVQITVTDCGTAADDIFEVYLDGELLGVTPKGTSNTWDRELRPGGYAVRIVCLDDGGDPLGDDVGTACLNITAYGEDVSIDGGGAPRIDYGQTVTLYFVITYGQATSGSNQYYDGSVHKARGLENSGN